MGPKKIFIAISLSLMIISFLPMRSSPQNLTPAPSNELIDKQKVKAFCDSMVTDILEDRTTQLYKKMETKFKKAYNQRAFNETLQNMYINYGKPVELKFKMAAEGTKEYGDGEVKQLRKLWYAAKTTKYQYGQYYLFIEVVPDGRSLGSSGFALVTFPMGAPPELK